MKELEALFPDTPVTVWHMSGHGDYVNSKALERADIHNDPPVTPPEPLHSMWVAVNRMTPPRKDVGPNLRITPEQALHAYTLGAAEVLGTEKETGKYAYFIVLSEDPLKVNPARLDKIRVL